MFCGNCGTQSNDTVRFCTRCGTALNLSIPPAIPSSPPPRADEIFLTSTTRIPKAINRKGNRLYWSMGTLVLLAVIVIISNMSSTSTPPQNKEPESGAHDFQANREAAERGTEQQASHKHQKAAVGETGLLLVSNSDGYFIDVSQVPLAKDLKSGLALITAIHDRDKRRLDEILTPKYVFLVQPTVEVQVLQKNGTLTQIRINEGWPGSGLVGWVPDEWVQH